MIKAGISNLILPRREVMGVNSPVHFVLHGAAEGRDPGAKFHTIWHFDRCSD
jgi:hypothetical protein